MDKRLRSDGSEMGSQGPSATGASLTNPGDNPQIQHLKYKIQIRTQNQLEENKKLRLITIKYKYKYRTKQISPCQTLSVFRHRAHTLYLYFPHQLIFRAGNFMPKGA